MTINRAGQEWPESERVSIEPIDHEGTKYEHMAHALPIDNRTPYNYCPLCNGWFPPVNH